MLAEPITASRSVSSEQYNRAYLWAVCLIAALGGLLFGYDWVVISGADIFYEKFFHLTQAADIGWAKIARWWGVCSAP